LTQPLRLQDAAPQLNGHDVQIVDKRKASTWRWLVLLAVGSALLALPPLLGESLEIPSWLQLAAGVFCAASAALLSVLVDHKRRSQAEPPMPGVPTGESLEKWRSALWGWVVGARVRAGGDLDKLIPDDVAGAGDEGQPRIRVQGRIAAWSELIDAWESGPGRMVILGDPGFGKTVAALSLLKHINGDSSSGPVAELFPLADWWVWHAAHPDRAFNHWLAAQLVEKHKLPQEYADALIKEGLVVPILDGLDEVPTEGRLECKKKIDRYAERLPPFRSFVLTCRAREYAELLTAAMRSSP